jgi:hypothetical protein
MRITGIDPRRGSRPGQALVDRCGEDYRTLVLP